MTLTSIIRLNRSLNRVFLDDSKRPNKILYINVFYTLNGFMAIVKNVFLNPMVYNFIAFKGIQGPKSKVGFKKVGFF